MATDIKKIFIKRKYKVRPAVLRTVPLLPENLHAYFELSAQAWILYKAPQWNAGYPNSCLERIKLKIH